MSKRIQLTLLGVLISFLVSAQLHIPAMDVQVKAGITYCPLEKDDNFNNYDYLAPTWSAELNWNINQYFSIGGLWSRSFPGENVTLTIDDYSQGKSTNLESMHQFYGLKVRASTGRQPRFRPFVEVSAGKYEMYIDYESYKIATEGNFFGVSIGLMIRLNNTLYLILPQLTLRKRSDPFFFEGANPPFTEATAGLCYNFGKKK